MLAIKKMGWTVALMLLLTGCGGGSAKRVDAPQSSRAPAGYGAAKSSAPSMDAAPAPAAESAAQPSASRERSAGRGPASESPDAEERPGLGTEWGETRVSRVHDVSFIRDSNRPFAVATINYNDRRGAEAMANTRGRRDREDLEVAGGAISVTIQDADGEPFETIRAGDRTIVVGQAGERYSIVLTNHTGHRFESVVTVDGLDVVNGKPGTTEHRGYVLSPFARLVIDGFRQSSNAVAAFRFGSVAESYAAQTGSARNVGVIGAAFFGERGDSFSVSDLRLRETATPFPADPRFARPPRR